MGHALETALPGSTTVRSKSSTVNLFRSFDVHLKTEKASGISTWRTTEDDRTKKKDFVRAD